MLRVLICPLNWGLGHATRCRPVIDLLVSRGHEVHLAGDGPALLILKKTYPELKWHDLAPLNIIYASMFWIKLIQQAPYLMRWVVGDQRRIKKLQEEFHFDLIISDSRPGCRIKGLINILINNQPSPIIPLGPVQRLVHWMLRWIYNRFDLVWIPDQEGDYALSGKLLDLPRSIAQRRVGFLSTLEQYQSLPQHEQAGRILAIVSGPEPTRTEFETDLLKRLKDFNALIVGGQPDRFIQIDGYISFLDTEDLAHELNRAEYIVCRAGYSTLMDLAPFNKKLVLVPTPGQSEQEYLAARIQGKKQGLIWDIRRKDWDTLAAALKQLKPFYIKNNPVLLVKAVEEIEELALKNGPNPKK